MYEASSEACSKDNLSLGRMIYRTTPFERLGEWGPHSLTVWVTVLPSVRWQTRRKRPERAMATAMYCMRIEHR